MSYQSSILRAAAAAITKAVADASAAQKQKEVTQKQNLANAEANLNVKNLSGIQQAVAEVAAQQQANIATMQVPDKVTIVLKNPPKDTIKETVDNFKFMQTKLNDIIGAVPISKSESIAKNFIETVPEIICVSEYYVENKFIGVLVVWEFTDNATHYEVFKKNTFSPADTPSGYEKILFIDKASIVAEAKNFISYFNDFLGFKLDSNIGVYLDTNVKKDRIYEYKIRSVMYPKTAQDVDYQAAFVSKNLVSTINIPLRSNTTVFQLAKTSFGNESFAWILCLMNEFLGYFGQHNYDTAISFSAPGSTLHGINLYVPDFQQLYSAISESISIFGLKNTMKSILNRLQGCPDLFALSFLDAIDETKQTFSYTKFKESIKDRVPNFKIILALTAAQNDSSSKLQAQQSAQLQSTLGVNKAILLPFQEGYIDLVTIEGLTAAFAFVNNCLFLTAFSQDPESFKKLQELLELELKAQEAIKNGLESTIEHTLSTPSQVLDTARTNHTDTLGYPLNNLPSNTLKNLG